MLLRIARFGVGLAGWGVLAGLALADLDWNGQTPPGLVTPINMRVEVIAIPGTSVDVDADSAPFAGSMHARVLGPGLNSGQLRIDSLQLNFGACQFTHEFFCQSPQGCWVANASVLSATHQLINPVTVQLNQGSFSFTAPFLVSFNAIVSGAFNGVHSPSGQIPITLSGTISMVKGVATLGSLSMSEYVFPFPPDSLPAGVTAANHYIRPLFQASDVLVGPMHVVIPPDINGDGSVDGADLAILLSNWGAIGGPADINHDQAVNGMDLGMLLGAWS